MGKVLYITAIILLDSPDTRKGRRGRVFVNVYKNWLQGK